MSDDEEVPCGECTSCRQHAASWGGARMDGAPTVVPASFLPITVEQAEDRPSFVAGRYAIRAWFLQLPGATVGVRVMVASRVVYLGLS